MKVQVWLRGHLKIYVPHKVGEISPVMEVKEGTTIGALLDHLKIPGGAAKAILVNGENATNDEILKNGDRVNIFPRMAAGG